MNIPFEGALRRKDFREAADAGLLLWRENFISFIPFFAIPLWVCAFALRMLPGKAQYLSWLIIWMLKPLFDRSVLHIISVRFFEHGANMKRLCHGLGKSLCRGLAGDLLWRRFSPLRSAMMPVRVLEQNVKSGRGIAERKRLLKKGGIDYCYLLTFWGAAVEIVLLIGEVIFFYMMAELIMKGFVYSLWSSDKSTEIYIYAAWCFNYMLVETIYVCMGFSLYINSRIEVEGWDIEIIFRNIAEKLKNKSKHGALVVFFLICILLPVKNLAAGEELFAVTDDIPLEKLQTILDSPDFGGKKDSWGIRLKEPIKPINRPLINETLMERIKRLQRIFAYFLQFLIISGIAGLLVFLLFYLRKFSRNKTGAIDNPAVKILHKDAIEAPESLLEKALGFHKQGKIRLAWGYCTAAVILSWPLYRGLFFPPNATESDCANMVSSMAANNVPANQRPPCNIEEARIFSELIKHWVYLAYAERLPPEGSFEEAAAFCKLLRTADG